MGLHSMTVFETGTVRAQAVAPDQWGVAWLKIATWLEGKIVEVKPEIVGFESPFMPPPPPRNKAARANWKGFAVSQRILRFLIGVATVFEMIAARHPCECVEVNVNTVKASLAGAKKKKDRDAELDKLKAMGVDKTTLKLRQRELMKITKDDMEAAAKRMGWKVADHHQADACGVGKVVIENRWTEGHKRNDNPGMGKRRRRVRR